MRRLSLLVFVAVMVLRADAAQHATSVTVDQLEQVLVAQEAAHRTDADIAQQLSGLELTERVSTARLARLKADLPGEKAQQALIALADSSVFLDPPAAEIPANPRPDAAALRQMLVSVVNYVNTTGASCPILWPRAIRPALKTGHRGYSGRGWNDHPGLSPIARCRPVECAGDLS
jgi:hypothetical protein